jgi:hypothetical protein
LVKGVVDLYEVEYFTVSFQSMFVWDVEVCPSACPNQIIRQQIPQKTFRAISYKNVLADWQTQSGSSLCLCSIGKLYLAVNRFLV